LLVNFAQLAVFAPGASRGYGEKICSHLGLGLAAIEEREFDDGEHKTRPLVSVRGKDVFVICSLYGDAQQSVNDKLCRLLFFIGALRDASANRVTAVTPYLCYARKDRKSKARDPVTTRYIASLFEAVGVDRVVTMDVHNLAAFQNAFRIRTDHLEARKLFVEYVAPLVQNDHVVVVSPDAGGVKRAEDFRLALSAATGRPVQSAFLEKHRSADIVSGEALIGKVAGCSAIIVDDLISSGTTLARGAETCRANGATRVLAAATHGVFSPKSGEILATPALERIVIADTIPAFRLGPGTVREKLVALDATKMWAEAIRRLHTNESILELLES
jgi:ribose-phosphate pyrophosphokinase